MTYKEKLKDPRWQKKRLEIFQRDNFTCQLCMNTTATLAIHHKKYIEGKEPFDYPDNYLITLCEICHKKIETNDGREALYNPYSNDTYRKNPYSKEVLRLITNLFIEPNEQIKNLLIPIIEEIYPTTLYQVSKNWDALPGNGKLEIDTYGHVVEIVRGFQIFQLEEKIRNNNTLISNSKDDNCSIELMKTNRELINKIAEYSKSNWLDW